MLFRFAVAAIALTACGRIGFGEQSPIDGSSEAAGPPAFPLELPDGGAFLQIAIAPNGTWYVRSPNSGVWRSRDQGATWTACVSGPPITGIGVGADNAVYFSGATMRMSTNECDSFMNVNTARYSNNADRAGGFMYAMTDQGIERKLDGQAAWAPVVTIPSTPFSPFAAREGTAPILLAGSTDGVFTSDLGAVWTQRTAGFATPIIRGVAAGATRTYAIAGANGPSSGGISCGDANGAGWSLCMNYGGTAIAVDPLDDLHVIAAVYDDFVETTNGFMTNTLGRRGAGGMSNALVHDVKFTPAGELIVASYRGVFVSPPGGSLAFQPRNQNLDAWTIERLLRDGDDLFVATEAGLARSIGGATFALDTLGIPTDTEFADVALAPNGDLLGIGRGIWRSTDRGATWTLVYALPDTEDYHAFSIELGANGRIYAGTQRRVVVADPPYANWTNTRAIDGILMRVGELLLHEGSLWAGTSMGLYVAQVAPDIAADVLTFTRVGDVGGDVTSIVALADGGLLVGTSTGIWTSDATRTTWTMRLPTSTRAVFRDGAISLAATSDGVYASRDGGVTWTQVPESDGLGTRGLAIDPGSGEVIYGVSGRGLARAAIP